MDQSGLRRKDTTKGPPLRILSLDGGGVRGYSMLILLQELMHRTFVEVEGRAPKRNEIPKPCEHFDLIAGTGTGGLIAIMLGRLRMDIETCKDVYVRMTKRVFETDKTFAGIPYRSTLFKASKLEEAIRECVREHSIFENEGNDRPSIGSVNDMVSPLSPRNPQRHDSNASRYSQIGASPMSARSSMIAASYRWGNPDAPLYDQRENRTKTAVTALYKGTPKNGSAILLRSYDSRKEPAPEFNCTVWQAGRATCATGLAFKPIQIGQSVFLDEGPGKYNPAPQILDEAVCNEWPGREVGVFISIGTGRRPSGTNQQQHLWWEGFVSSGIGDFAEARRRLISKIEGCETTHQYMKKEHLSKRHVNPENYYRLNVEVGVGEFGMNEWNRLADISTNTRMYLAKSEVQNMNMDAAAKLARIHKAKIRWERQLNGAVDAAKYSNRPLPTIPAIPAPSNPLAVELPADDVPMSAHSDRPMNNQLLTPSQYPRPQVDDKILVYSDQYPQVVDAETNPRRSSDFAYRRSGDFGSNPHSSNGSFVPSPRISAEDPRVAERHGAVSPPPLPPKTPIPAGSTLHRPSPSMSNVLPYPDTDGPPPIVNKATKPAGFSVR